MPFSNPHWEPSGIIRRASGSSSWVWGFNMTTAGPCGPGCTHCTVQLPTSGPRGRAPADGAAALAPTLGRVYTAMRVKPSRASRPRGSFLPAPWIGPGVQGSLGSPCHWLPTAEPCPFHPSRHAHRRKAEPSKSPSHGRGMSRSGLRRKHLRNDCPRYAGFGARSPSGKFSGGVLRLRGAGHAPSRQGPSPGEKPLPARAFCRKPRPPRGSATLAPPPSSAFTAGAPRAGCSARLQGDLTCDPAGILRSEERHPGASTFGAAAAAPPPQLHARIPHLVFGAGQREERLGWASAAR